MFKQGKLKKAVRLIECQSLGCASTIQEVVGQELIKLVHGTRS